MTVSTSIMERIIEPRSGGFSEEHAHYILSLGFSPQEQERYAYLARKSNEGTLTPEEQAALDEFLATNTVLTILQSKARISLKQHHSAN